MLNKEKSPSNKGTLQQMKAKEKKSHLELDHNQEKASMGPKKVGLLKTVKFLIYAAFVIVFAAGIINFLKNDQPRIIRNEVIYDITPVESDTAKSFAAAFTREYLTFNNDKTDFVKRVSPFITSELNNGIDMDTVNKNTEVKDALVWKVEKLNKDNANITVRADLVVSDIIDNSQINTSLKNTEIISKPSTKKKTVFLEVPIEHVNGQFIVNDYPTFVANMDTPEVDYYEYQGENQVSDSTKAEIKTVLESFFSNYCKANKLQLSYFMKDSKEFKGLEGLFEFSDVINCSAYDQGNNKVTSVCQVEIIDPDTGAKFLQKYTLDMIKDTTENRWYIESIIFRGNKVNEKQNNK